MPPDLSDSSAQTAAKERCAAHSGDAASRAPDPRAEADHDESAHNADSAANPGQDLGCNSIDILNFVLQTGRETGPSSGPHSVLGHSEFRHVSKLKT